MRTNSWRFLITLVAGTGLAGCAGSGGDDDGPGPTGPMDLIDDLEDGDDAINESNGRMGGWYTFNDESTTGNQIPPGAGFTTTTGGAEGSAFSAGTSGSGFTVWGAGMGFDLNNPEAVGMTGPRSPYDASRFTSIAFKAKGNVPITVSLEIVGVTPTDRGGTCTPSTVMGEECDDLHGTLVDLTGEWKDYVVEFGQLRQGGWGKNVPFAAADVTAVLFQADKDVSFDIAVDDIRFYE
ncbi:MAG TPA: hypothetical protein VM261_31185 [Kofleriaceae bacterium]|nr:hypothetical protein [Kofleriaceae bacterium]